MQVFIECHISVQSLIVKFAMETETVSPKACEPCSLENHKNEYVIVKIPNLFVSFLAEEPEINPHYGRVKLESEAWINECVQVVCEKASYQSDQF